MYAKIYLSALGLLIVIAVISGQLSQSPKPVVKTKVYTVCDCAHHSSNHTCRAQTITPVEVSTEYQGDYSDCTRLGNQCIPYAQPVKD